MVKKTFGNQGISGFSELMGATKAVGTADEVTYFEETRLHPLQTITEAGGTAAGTSRLLLLAKLTQLVEQELTL